MIYYFNKYMQLCVQNITDSQFLFNLWNLHFSSIIRITKYAETRVAIFGLVNKSIEKTYSNICHATINDKERFVQQKMFLKYSTFFG